MNSKPYFIDTTLRDGEQAPGVAFTPEEKRAIVLMLDEAGVPELEIGIPAMGADVVEEMLSITRLKTNCKTLSWCRAMESDLRMAAQTKTNGVHISFPVSDRLLLHMHKTKDWVLQEVFRLIQLASYDFDYVTIGAQDASRANIHFLRDFAGVVSDAGASRLRLADTVGLLNPFTTKKMVQTIHRTVPDMALEFHAHNDLGMACANTLAAWMAGAHCLSTTVNGLGERAGNAAMEEVAVALALSAKVEVPLRMDHLPGLCQFVETASCRQNGASKPIVGSMVLAHESGIHTHCLKQDRRTYQLIPAQFLGLTETAFNIGKHSNKSALKYALEIMGYTCDETLIDALMLSTRAWCNQYKRHMMPEDLMQLYQTLATK